MVSCITQYTFGITPSSPRMECTFCIRAGSIDASNDFMVSDSFVFFVNPEYASMTPK